VLLFGVPFALLMFGAALLGAGDLAEALAQILATGIVVAFMPWATVSARRYRLSRTSWRGIRFSVRARARDFFSFFFRDWRYNFIDPAFVLYAFIVSHSYFGTRRFRFDGTLRNLYRSYLLAILLTIPTLGLCWVWYQARKRRYFWDHTSFGAARFDSTITGRRLLRLHAVNLLLLTVTLGLAWPWVKVRNIRFICDHVTLQGPLDLAAIQQEAQRAAATGEELAGFLDLDAGIG